MSLCSFVACKVIRGGPAVNVWSLTLTEVFLMVWIKLKSVYTAINVLLDCCIMHIIIGAFVCV